MTDLSAFQPDEHPVSPRRKFDGRQSVLLAIEIANSAKVRRAFQFAFQRIRPAMIRTTHLVRVSRGFSHHRRGVMATNVEEAAHDLVAAAHDHDRLADDIGRDEISRFWELIGARSELPRTPKDHLLFKFENTLVRVPRSGNG